MSKPSQKNNLDVLAYIILILGALTMLFMGDALANTLSLLGFVERPEDERVVVGGDAAALPAADRWYLTEADRDV